MNVQPSQSPPIACFIRLHDPVSISGAPSRSLLGWSSETDYTILYRHLYLLMLQYNHILGLHAWKASHRKSNEGKAELELDAYG